jgi:hypothetical protein
MATTGRTDGQDDLDLISDERLYQTIYHGAPIVIHFEDAAEASVLEQLVSVMLERTARRPLALVQ